MRIKGFGTNVAEQISIKWHHRVRGQEVAQQNFVCEKIDRSTARFTWNSEAVSGHACEAFCDVTELIPDAADHAVSEVIERPSRTTNHFFFQSMSL